VIRCHTVGINTRLHASKRSHVSLGLVEKNRITHDSHCRCGALNYFRIAREPGRSPLLIPRGHPGGSFMQPKQNVYITFKFSFRVVALWLAVLGIAVLAGAQQPSGLALPVHLLTAVLPQPKQDATPQPGATVRVLSGMSPALDVFLISPPIPSHFCRRQVQNFCEPAISPAYILGAGVSAR